MESQRNLYEYVKIIKVIQKGGHFIYRTIKDSNFPNGLEFTFGEFVEGGSDKIIELTKMIFYDR